MWTLKIVRLSIGSFFLIIISSSIEELFDEYSYRICIELKTRLEEAMKKTYAEPLT